MAQIYELTVKVVGSDTHIGDHGYIYWYPPRKYAAAGMVFSLRANPRPGYRVKRWTNTDDDTIILNENKITMSQDVTVYVEFEPDVDIPQFSLTTSVVSGQGSIKQPGCSWAEKILGESCTFSFDQGQQVEIIATPDDEWQVSRWKSSVSGVFLSDPGTSASATITIPSEDVSITVEFTHVDVDLTLSVGGGGGCISLVSPEGYNIDCSGETVQLSDIEVRVVATPLNSEWEVSSWFIDGVDQSTTASFLDVSLEGVTDKSIVAYFSRVGDCVKNTLTVNITGKGTVSPPLGNYCEETTLALNPTCSMGYYFKEWQYDLDSGITEDGLLLLVPMNISREITAVFERRVGYQTSDPTLFYCSSENYKDNVVSFDFTNTSPFNPSQSSNGYHFRINFYTDVEKTKLVYSTFSLIDNKRWFYDDGFYDQLPMTGVVVNENETTTIVYDPEILFSQIMETQKEHVVNSEIVYEKPLVCGVQYYVDIESYNIFTEQVTFLKTINLMLECESVDSYYWDYNEDKNNWLCSGQGKSDLKVAGNSGQSIYPSISSNIFGLFQIVWQGRRKDGNHTYGAKWDSEKDMLFSSGQGSYDVLELPSSNHPIVVADQASSFYITGSTRDSIAFNACPVLISDSPPPDDPLDLPAFESFCYPGSVENLGGGYDQIKMRVHKDDISSSLVVNRDKVVPVITQKDIRLEVDGIVGAYAVRLRNIEDSSWGDWINIDSELYPYTSPDAPEGVTPTGPIGDDIVRDAYRIDNSRFIVGWNISKTNGLRRICCQVLTLYGISNSFCIDILANFDVAQHVFEFYLEDPTNPVDPANPKKFPVHNGQYVLSLKDDITEEVLSRDSITVYFKAIFSEEIYKDENTTESYVDDEIRFNVIQQGINDQRNEFVKVIDDKTFWGAFSIFTDDGIFNKDGAAFIELVFPEVDNTTEICIADKNDKYNINSVDLDEKANIALVPEEVFEKYQADQLSKALDINKFKQYYDKDDTNFKFGNPGYYRK
jgi:hypothetical protein